MEQSLISLSPMQSLPTWGMFLMMLVIVLSAEILGYRLARYRIRKSDQVVEGPISSVVGAVMGLLAFMLAFTFSMSAGRFDTRKQLLLDDVNAISTTSMRAQLLPEPHDSECRELLRRYVDIRVKLTPEPEVIARSLEAAKEIQLELWKHAMDLAKSDMNSDIGALFVESLNEMFILHNSRVTVALLYRIPPVIWYVLIMLTALSMAGVGYQFGLTGRLSILVHLILGISFSLVVTLIADLDKPTSNMLQVSRKPMLELQRQLSDQGEVELNRH